MGTTYNIKYIASVQNGIKPSDIDSILVEINNSVSTYIPESTISVINTDSSGQFDETNQSIHYAFIRDPHFQTNFEISKSLFAETDGFFDPSIMPLVNYWGFGYTEKSAISDVDSIKVDSLKALIGFDHWQLEKTEDSISVSKNIGAELDFSAIAKGYAVDVLAEYMDINGVGNYMVEIGGEVKCKGTNQSDKIWTIGLSKPEVGARLTDFQALLSIDNKAMASSGNYRNYYQSGDKFYGHEINPKTGYPEINALLGTTVIHDNCAIADALATAFMVMGLERSKNWLAKNNSTQAVLFFQSDNGEIEYFITPDIVDKVKFVD